MAGMVVQHNMNALGAYNKLNTNVSGLKKSSEKLASGYRINRAGDDAAGLAISEKMRSQIRGLSQAKRNAQDGISMIQTFEGALQESHSILQRMKELATESANGTYDNPVDRAAIQLEFDQLNDELNQIADTDFNGTVVLNGGQMADGAVADKVGMIDYANQPGRAAAAWGANDVNTIDSKGYNATTAAADNLWNNLGLSEDVESVDLTFKYDADTDTWAISDASDAAALANKANVKIIKGGADADITDATTAANNNGGFSLVSTATQGGTQIAGTDAPAAYDAAGAGFEYANVILDSSKLIDGDTITLTFTRPPVDNTAPENAGVADGTYTEDFAAGVTSVSDPTIAINPQAGSDANASYHTTNMADGDATKEMTEEAAAAFNGLNGAEIEVTYKATGAAAASVSGIKLTLADGTVKNLEVATTAKAGQALTTEDGTKYTIDVAANGASFTIKDDQGVELATITNGTLTGAGMTTGNESTVSYELRLDEAIYDATSEPKVSITGGEDSGVSKANAYDKSTAKMTYADDITLQVGARTKDAVNFTFSYESEGMGDLAANLDVSARANGLNTANLSLATQEDANAAIDKIDNAINKVSMVRATFGSIQNRLEHKIENITATTENLTEAESTIRDTDMASEMMNYTKFNILQQAAQSMLAQANQQPQSILQLLG